MSMHVICLQYSSTSCYSGYSDESMTTQLSLNTHCQNQSKLYIADLYIFGETGASVLISDHEKRSLQYAYGHPALEP